MNTQLLEIHPRELKFLFEVKKQSSCALHLTNLTDQYVAFKVKTTSPRKYCVRPNVGIIKPKTTCDFTVTMQAQKSPMVDCKDKFLIQSTLVPYGKSEEDITSNMFSKESQNYVEETKLRVVLTSAQNSPTVLPPEIFCNQDPVYDHLVPKEPSPVLSPVNGAFKQEPIYEASKPNDKLHNEVENFPSDMLIQKVEEHQNGDSKESISLNANNKMESNLTENEDCSKTMQISSHSEEVNNDAEEMRSRIAAMESKLLEAEQMIIKLKQEKNTTFNDNKVLKPELGTMNRTRVARRVQVGFPPLFVFMVGLICLVIGGFLF